MPRRKLRIRYRDASWLICVIALGLIGIVVAGLVGFCVARRLAYPFELSWMEGCFVDHARRAAAGEPIYAAPSAEFVPLLYTPIAHHVASWLIRAGVNGFLATRLVSLLGILGSTVVGMWLAARATRHKWICLVVPVLVAATYFDVGAYYDVARPDNLMVLFCVTALAALTLNSTRWSIPLFVICATLAVFTKQSSLIFFAVLLCGLLLVRWKVAVGSAFLLLLTVGVTFVCANAITEGWFRVYTLGIPSHHGLTHGGLLHSIVDDFLGSFALMTTAAIMTAGVLVVVRSKLHRPRDREDRAFLLLFYGLIAAGIYSAASRWSIGGAENALVLYAIMGAIFLPACIAKAADQFSEPTVRAIAWRLGMIVLLLAACRGVTNPSSYVPSEEDSVTWEQFRSRLAQYGPPERIWVTSHGAALGAKPGDPCRPHVLPIINYVGGQFGSRTGFELSGDLLSPIERQYFAAIVVCDREFFTQELIKPYYRRAKREPAVTLPEFSGWRPGKESIWVPKAAQPPDR